jgi:hypothetical protein
MKTGNCKNILRIVLLGFFCVTASAISVRAYVPMRWGTNGVRGAWAPSRFPLTFCLNNALAKGGANIDPGSDTLAAVRAAISSWQSIQTANIRFAEIKLTSVESTLNDGINLITMADTVANRDVLGVRPGDSGAVAQTRIIFNRNTGEITETDIILNPRYQFSTNLAFGTYDLQSILTHEIGHALGCDHSPVQSDTMYFSMAAGEFYQRNLSADAIAFAGNTYPNQSRIASQGTITGRIASGSTGISGASVTAVNVDRNLIYAALSEPDGAFSIKGAAAGRYSVFAEPLDGAATPDQLLVQGTDAYYKSLNTSFRTVFIDNQTLVLDGAARNLVVNLAVPAGTPTLNIDRMGRGDLESGLGYLSPGPVSAIPGETVSLWIGGVNTWQVAGIRDVKILGTGVTLDEFRGLKILKDGIGAPVGISVLVHIAPDAAPGPRTVVIDAINQRAASTGGLIVTARALPQTTLFFPYLKTTSDQYTGIALANPTPDTPAVIRMSGRDSQGALLWGEDATVPADFALAGGTQLARVDRQIFNLPINVDYVGSMMVQADIPNLQGFFLNGDFACTYLDGAEAFTQGYRQLFFVDTMQNAETTSEIHLMNIKDFPISVDLRLVGQNGSLLAVPIQTNLPAGGKIGGSISSLFGIASELHSAHISASSSEDALAGFGLIRQVEALAGLNALPAENAGSLLYSPQFAVGDLGLPMNTRLNVVNVGDSRVQISIELLDEGGKPLVSDAKSVGVEPGGQVSLDVRSMSGLERGQGYIRISGPEGAKLLGNVLFGSGDPATSRLSFDAAVPLFSSGTRNFVFSHIAQGSGYYTGLAFLAPDGARITVEAFDRDGTVLGHAAMLDLTVGQRMTALLSQLIPETDGQVGGYVKVTADRAIMGFELFGSTDGHVLSAVPLQRLLN